MGLPLTWIILNLMQLFWIDQSMLEACLAPKGGDGKVSKATPTVLARVQRAAKR